MWLFDKSIFYQRWQTCIIAQIMVPTPTGKLGKMGEHFPVREKQGNFEQTGKVGESYNLTKIAGKLGNFRQFVFFGYLNFRYFFGLDINLTVFKIMEQKCWKCKKNKNK